MPAALYVQELETPDGRVFKRSKGVLRTDGHFRETEEEWIKKVCPEALAE